MINIFLVHLCIYQKQMHLLFETEEITEQRKDILGILGESNVEKAGY